MELDLRHLFAALRRRLWILLVIPAVAGLAAYGLTSRQTPTYEATSVVMVNPTTSSGSSSYDAILSSQSLIQTFRQLVKSRPVMEAVITDLSLPLTVGELQNRIDVATVEGTQLLRITATDSGGQRSAAIANATGTEFAKFVADQAKQVSSTFRNVLDEQIQETKQQIDDTAKQIQQLESQPTLTSDQQAQLSILKTQLQQLQDSYGHLFSTSQTMVLDAAAAQAQVTITEEAVQPTAPSAPRVAFRTALGLVAGLLIAGVTVFVLEYMDNTVKARMDFVDTFGVPLLASVEKMPKIKEPRKQLFAFDKAKGRSQEAIRLLRTNLEFADATKQMRSLAFGSATAGEGKSTITANLAVAMAQVEIPVVVIDADMRQPTQHKIFQTRNEAGLSTLLSRPGRSWESVAIEPGIPNLRLIPSGPPPPDPADLLDHRLDYLIEELEHAGYFILIDTPPILATSDALIVCGRVDGIVLIGRDRHTRIDALRRAISLVTPAGTRIMGIVLNQHVISGREGHYGAYVGRSDKQGPPRATVLAPPSPPVTRPSASLTPSDGQ